MKITLTETSETFEDGNWLLDMHTPNPRCDSEVIGMHKRYKDKPDEDERRKQCALFKTKVVNYVKDWAPTPTKHVFKGART